jgi:chromosome segregation ATPase
MDILYWVGIAVPFVFGGFAAYYFKMHHYQRLRAEVFKHQVEEYVQTSMELARDLEICKARNSSLKQDLIRARDEGGVFTREANRMGRDVFQMNQQIADLKAENKKLIRDIRDLEKEIQTGKTGI